MTSSENMRRIAGWIRTKNWSMELAEVSLVCYFGSGSSFV